MEQNQRPSNDLIEKFIRSQVVNRGLDERTEKAYRLDLELFYQWMDVGKNDRVDDTETDLEERQKRYLDYLFKEKGLRYSTICRKRRVLSYYRIYLAKQGILEDRKAQRQHQAFCISKTENLSVTDSEKNTLTKKEIDKFFQAIDQEYSELESDFRKRVCLRDQVMMKLLFYHGIEISELLRLKVTDYDRRTKMLGISGKKGKNRSVYLFSKELQQQMSLWLDEHIYFEREEVYRNQLFLSKLGKPISMKMIIIIFDKYRIRAGIQKESTPKDLKNSLGRYAEEMVRELG